MADLIERAADLWFNGADANAVWAALHEQYAQYGDPIEIHVQVLDGSNELIRAAMLR